MIADHYGVLEAGVRFVERGKLGKRDWDQHNNVKAKLTANATAVDKQIDAILYDLK